MSGTKGFLGKQKTKRKKESNQPIKQTNNKQQNKTKQSKPKQQQPMILILRSPNSALLCSFLLIDFPFYSTFIFTVKLNYKCRDLC